ncbi:sensor histidine kinase [Geobacillus thermodenitrificans]|nr:sensor histidine kinase [Geobacillus thermodenitrificans]
MTSLGGLDMFKNTSLIKKFLIIYILLISLPTLLFATLIYHMTTEIIKEQARKDTLEQLEKVEQHLASILLDAESTTLYMIYDHNFRNFFTTSGEGVFKKTYKDAVERINGYFTFRLTSNPYMNSVFLYSLDGNKLVIGEPISGNEEQMRRKAEEGQGKPVWSGPYSVSSEWGGKKNVIILSRIINDYYQVNKKIGTAIISIDIEKLLKDFTINEGSYLIVSKEGKTILHPDPSLVGDQYPDFGFLKKIQSNKSSSFSYEIKGQEYLAVKKSIEGTDWYLVVTVQTESIVRELYHLLSTMTSLLLVLLLLGIVALVFFYRSILRRIKELTIQTEEVEKGNFTARVKVNANDEIGKLGLCFNKMVNTIQKHIDIEYKLKIKQKESQLNALQSQINPHFLYNTLDMIRWTARLENAYQTGHLIELLSRIFRMNLNKGRKWVTVEEEMRYIRSYLELQKYRMGERLDYDLSVDDSIKNAFLMKQTLLPLVENSIVHGFKDLPYQGIIHIDCYRVGDQLWIDVVDNGWGFDLDKEGMSGFALNNLIERISLAFGAPYGLTQLHSEKGASLRIILPFISSEQLAEITEKLGE